MSHSNYNTQLSQRNSNIDFNTAPEQEIGTRQNFNLTELENLDQPEYKDNSEMQNTTQGWIKDQAIAQANIGIHVELQKTQSTLVHEKDYTGGFADKVKELTMLNEEELLLDDKDPKRA